MGLKEHLRSIAFGLGLSLSGGAVEAQNLPQVKDGSARAADGDKLPADFDKAKTQKERLMPNDFKKIPEGGRAVCARGLLQIYEDTIPGLPKFIDLFDKKTPEEQKKIARNIFEISRFFNLMMLRKFIGLPAQLDGEEKGLFAVHGGKMQEMFGNSISESALEQFVVSTSKGRLHVVYLKIKIAVETAQNYVEGQAPTALASPLESTAKPTEAPVVVAPSQKPPELQPSQPQLAVKTREAFSLPVVSAPKTEQGVNARVRLREKPVPSAERKSNKFVGYEDPREKRFPGNFFMKGRVIEFDGKPTINLTFDDGPDAKWTPRILDILNQNNVKATFYVQGAQIRGAANIAVLKRIVSEGHELALHSVNHPHEMAKNLSPSEVWEKEVEPVMELVKQHTGKDIRVFRAPEGSISDDQIRELVKHGIIVVGWSIDTEDYRFPGKSNIISRVSDNAYPGSIALMHSTAARAEATADALPWIIANLKAKDYAMITTSEILGLGLPAGAKPEQNTLPSVTTPPSKSEESSHGSEKVGQWLGGGDSLFQEIIGSLDGGTPDAKVEKELPKGAFGFDTHGQPFGWNFENNESLGGDGKSYIFVANEQQLAEIEKKLAPPIDGKHSKTHKIMDKNGQDGIRLVKDAFDAYKELCMDFHKTVPRDSGLFKIGIWLTEGFRTFDRQRMLIKKYNLDKRGQQISHQAAEVGASAHHLGTTIDIHDAKVKVMFEWLYEKTSVDFDGKKIDVPRIIKFGFAPTVPNEVWHFRFVGQKMAVAYWKEFGGKIMKAHSTKLPDTAPEFEDDYVEEETSENQE